MGLVDFADRTPQTDECLKRLDAFRHSSLIIEKHINIPWIFKPSTFLFLKIPSQVDCDDVARMDLKLQRPRLSGRYPKECYHSPIVMKH